MSTAVVFAGQGSQYVGMGTDFVETDSEWFNDVVERLSFPLDDYLSDGPAETLARTDVTQPSVFVVNHLIYRYLTADGLSPEFFAGHSLGEYNALVASGRISFSELLPVVEERGQAMHEAARRVDGGMAAVLKLDENSLREICETINDDESIDGTVEIALLNAPSQIVISGATSAIDAAVDRAKDEGALKAVSLDVSGPWHSQYMKPATERLKSALEDVEWDSGDTLVTNVNASPLEDESPEQSLIDQLEHPVRWEASVNRLIDLGARTFVEVGPGDSLSGMIKRIGRNRDETIAIHHTDTLEQTRETLKEVAE